LLILLGMFSGQARAGLIGGGLILLAAVLEFAPTLTYVIVAASVAIVVGVAMYLKGQGWYVASYFVLPFGAVGLAVCAYTTGMF
jgi:hypothetical protein